MQLSEAGNYHKDTSCSPNKNGELLDLDDSKHNIVNEQAALATSSENDQCGNHSPTCSESGYMTFSTLFSDENSTFGEIGINAFSICARSIFLVHLDLEMGHVAVLSFNYLLTYASLY
ncbi:hypothetical protein GH714_010746, partial [Hevea brasiliensis]